MTDDIPAEQPPEDAPAPERASGVTTPWSRYLKIGVPILVAVAVAAFVFWPRIEISLAINGLHASDGRARSTHVETLKNHPEKELVIEALVDSVQDESHSFEVRRICCGLLVNHFNRLGTLNPLLQKGSLHTRGVILTTLMHEDYFVKEYVEDPRYRVRETIAEWLGHAGDMTRMYAIQLASRLKMKELMPAIRPLLVRTRADGHGRQERDVMIAAAGAVERFEDCESVPTLAEVAERDPDHLVRLRFMQILDRVAFRERPASACAGRLDEARMAALVRQAVSDDDHRVRMGAMLLIGRHPEWAGEAAAHLQSILDGDHSTAERRQALAALVALKQPAFLERFPLYFHDDAPEVIRTAVQSVSVLEGQGFDGCVVGLIGDLRRDESVEATRDTRYQLWRDAMEHLHRVGKTYRGFPNELNVRAAKDRVGFAKDLLTLFTERELVVTAVDGTFARVTLDATAEAWFRWWCEDRGLDEAATTSAVAAWRACRAARARGDVEGARKALSALTIDAPNLFAYERAWIARQGR